MQRRLVVAPQLHCVLMSPSEPLRHRPQALVTWLTEAAIFIEQRGLESRLDTSLHTSGAWTPARWSRVREKLLAGTLDSVGIGAAASPEKSSISIHCMGLVQTPAASILLSASFGSGPALTEREFIDLCVRGARAAEAWQALLLPYLPARALSAQFTRREVAARRAGVEVGAAAFQHLLRGGGWGLWLGPDLVAGLGGPARVRAEAPVETVARYPGGIWFELTTSPWDVPTERLAALESYLGPVLLTPERALALQEPEPTPPPEPPLEPADDYPDYQGPPLPLDWLTELEGDIVLNLHLQTLPSPSACAALERAVSAWFVAGSEGAFSLGSFHDLRGPAADGLIFRWSLDPGFAEVDEAVEDLARRLAGWSAAWACPVEVLAIGKEAP